MRSNIGPGTFPVVCRHCAATVKSQPLDQAVSAVGSHGYQFGGSQPPDEWSAPMLVVGLILLLIGIFAHISILYTIGIILLIVGAVFWILGSVGRPIGGRKYWY
jgi:hypothetical protein